MENDILNDRQQNKSARQGMAMQNQQPAWNVNPTTKGQPTNPEDKIALFAVPLPSPKKSDYLCLCKRLFWNVGSSYFTAFCPLSPDETRTLPLASTVVQLVCASPASVTDSTGKKRVPHDLLAYNAQGNIIGVPYLSIHRDTQQQEHQTNGIPYPDISNSAWVPALNVPFVGSSERKTKERLEDVVFIIRNEKQPGDILHQNGNMPMLFSKQATKKDSPVVTDESKLPAVKKSVPTSQQPKLGNDLQTKSHNALDLSQRDGLTTLPKKPKKAKLVSPKSRQRPIFPCPQGTVPCPKSPVAGRSASPIKANVSATSTSLYRAYNSKWKEQQKGSSPTLTVDAMGAKNHDAATPPAPGSTNETCDAPHEMVLPQIGSVFSLVDCSSPDENLPKRITDALLKTTHSNRNKLPGKSQHTEQPVQTAPLGKKTDEPLLKSRDGKVKKQNKGRRKRKKCGSPSLEQETTYRQSAITPSIALHKPIEPPTTPSIAPHKPIGPSTTPCTALHKPIGPSTTPSIALHKPKGPSTTPMIALHKPKGPSTTPSIAPHKPKGPSTTPSIALHKPKGPSTTPSIALHKPIEPSTTPSIALHKPIGSSTTPSIALHKPIGPSTTPSIALRKPIGPSCETVRQNAPLEQTMQIPAAPTSTVQFQQIMASAQPIRQTNNEKHPTGNCTEPDKQSSYRPTCPMQSPQGMGQLGHTRPLQQATSLGSTGILSKEVSSKLPNPQPIKTLFNFIGGRQASTLATMSGHKTKKDKTRYLNKTLNDSGLTVREILELSRVDRENGLQPAVYSASAPNILPLTPLARYGLSPTFKESSNVWISEMTPKTDKLTTTSTTETLPTAIKSSGNRSIFSTSVPSLGTSKADSRNVVNGNERVSNQITIESDISRIGSVRKEQMSAQTLPATSVEIPHAPCISQIGMPLKGPIPAGEITITNNLGLDNVKFVRRWSSTEVVIDGTIPCLKLDKINYNLHSVNMSTTQTRDSVMTGIGDASHSNTDQLMTIDSQWNVPCHEDQSRCADEGHSNSKDPWIIDSTLFGYTQKKVKHRGTTLKKPKTKRKPGRPMKIKRPKSGNRYSSSLNRDIDSTLRDGSQCLTECQSIAVPKTKKMRFSGKGSQRYDLNVSTNKPSDDQIRKGYNQEATSMNVKTNNVHTTVVHPCVDVEDWSGRTSVKLKGIDVDNLGNWSASSESDFSFSPKRLNPNDSDSDASLEDSSPVYSFSGNLGVTETPRFYENSQHMTVQEKVRVLQETKQKHEMALNALKKM